MTKRRLLFSKDWFDAYFCGVPSEERGRGVETVRILNRSGCGFRLEIYLYSAIAGLDLIHPSLDGPVDIGYADQARWLPWSLRVQEVESFCAAATVEPSTEHGAEVARALLAPFTLPTTSADGEAQWTAMRQALSKLGFSDEEVVHLRDRRAFHCNGFGILEDRPLAWAKRDGRWLL